MVFSHLRTTPYVMGAMQLLARAFTREGLNARGFALYADFRPQIDKWGGQSEMRMISILALRESVSDEVADAPTPSVVIAKQCPANATSQKTTESRADLPEDSNHGMSQNCNELTNSQWCDFDQLDIP